MKRIVYKTLLCLFSLAFSLQSNSQSGSLSVTVDLRALPPPIFKQNFDEFYTIAFFKTEERILLLDTVCQIIDTFSFGNIQPGNYTIKIAEQRNYGSYAIYSSDSFTISPGTKSHLAINPTNIFISGNTDSSGCIYNQLSVAPLCQKCHKNNKVIGVVHGYPSKKTLRSARRGKFILAGCMVSSCDPWWYCKRDKVYVLKYYW